MVIPPPDARGSGAPRDARPIIPGRAPPSADRSGCLSRNAAIRVSSVRSRTTTDAAHWHRPQRCVPGARAGESARRRNRIRRRDSGPGHHKIPGLRDRPARRAADERALHPCLPGRSRGPSRPRILPAALGREPARALLLSCATFTRAFCSSPRDGSFTDLRWSRSCCGRYWPAPTRGWSARRNAGRWGTSGGLTRTMAAARAASTQAWRSGPGAPVGARGSGVRYLPRYSPIFFRASSPRCRGAGASSGR